MPPPLSARTMARIAEGAKQFLPNPATGNEPFVVPRRDMTTPKKRAQAALKALNALDSLSWPADADSTPERKANDRARVALTELIQWLGFDTKAVPAGTKAGPWALVVDKPIATDKLEEQLVHDEFLIWSEGAGYSDPQIEFTDGRWLASATSGDDGRTVWFDVRDHYAGFKDYPPTHTVSFHDCDD